MPQLLGIVGLLVFVYFVLKMFFIWVAANIVVWLTNVFIYATPFVLPFVVLKLLVVFDRISNSSPMRRFVRNNSVYVDEMNSYLDRFQPNYLNYINENRANDARNLHAEINASISIARAEKQRLLAIIGARIGKIPTDEVLRSWESNGRDDEIIRMYLRRIGSKVGMRV